MSFKTEYENERRRKNGFGYMVSQEEQRPWYARHTPRRHHELKSAYETRGRVNEPTKLSRLIWHPSVEFEAAQRIMSRASVYENKPNDATP